jgi:hypothetical protein
MSKGWLLDKQFSNKQERGMLLPPPISANLAFTCCVIILQAAVTETVYGCDLDTMCMVCMRCMIDVNYIAGGLRVISHVRTPASRGGPRRFIQAGGMRDVGLRVLVVLR